MMLTVQSARRLLFTVIIVFVALTAVVVLPDHLQHTAQASPHLAAVAGVTLDVPAEVFIGEDFSFTVTFDNNAGTNPGFGPFIDLVFPANGVDGAASSNPPMDGITFLSADFLGLNVALPTITFPGPAGSVTCVDHPLAVDGTGAPLEVCGPAGDQLVVIELPFGSFAVGQSPAVVTVNAHLSNLADRDAPLPIHARGGFHFGNDALENPICCDPSIATPASTDSSTWPGSPITPTLLEVEKTNGAPEDETATGPNFPHTYTITVDLAAGQTVTNFDVTDYLPNNMAYLGNLTSTPAYSAVVEPAVGVPANNSQLVATYNSVTGGTGIDITLTFDYYISLNDANGNPVIPANSGDDVLSENRVDVLGDWTPIDGRDIGGTDNVYVHGTCPTCPPADTLNDKSVAIQKGMSTITPPLRSQSIIEYTLDFQVSDFFAFDDLVITDVISDGQHFLGSFAPTLELTEHGATTGPLAFNPANFTELQYWTGGAQGVPAPAPYSNGDTVMVFRVSDELITRLGANADLIAGGCVPDAGTGGPVPDCGTYNAGPTYGRIVFRTQVLDSFTDDYPSNDASVDHGDILTDDVTVTGLVLNVADAATPTGSDESDTSGASDTIAQGTLEKTLYAINGSTSFASPPEVVPTDTVTYRVRYEMPSSDFENFSITDFLPLPIFDATEVTTFSIAGGIPPAGTATYGPGDTLHLVGGAPTPALSTDGPTNTVVFDYGTFDDLTNTDSYIDILFTVTVQPDPFADDLYLTNEASSYEDSTNGGDQQQVDIVQIIIREPRLKITKGIVSTDSGNNVFSPATTGPGSFTDPGTAGTRFTPPFTSDDVTDDPIDSNVSGVDASDFVTFALVIQNSGGRGAFDIKITDTPMPGFIIPPGALNLTITRGDGQPIGYTGADTDLFGAGIELVDPPGEPACQVANPTDGRDIIIITYDLQIDPAVAGDLVITNTATIEQYAGQDGVGTTDNYVQDRALYQDTATTTINAPTVAKSIVQTSEAHTAETTPRPVVIGEIVRYRLEVMLPEGSDINSAIHDYLPGGLQYLPGATTTVAFVSTAPGSLTSSAAGLAGNPAGLHVVGDETTLAGITPTFQMPTGLVTPATFASGTDPVFNLGTLLNGDNDDDQEFVVIEFNALVLNIAGNQAGNNRDNRFDYTTDGKTYSSGNVRVTIREPQLTITKTPDGATGDAGNVVTFTVVIAHSTNVNNPTAYNVEWTDTIPAGMTYVPGTLATTGVAPATLVDGTAPALSATWPSLASGESSTLTFDVTLDYALEPAQTVTNTADVTWTSLPDAGTTSNPTGSDTPGGSGTPTGERTGQDGAGNLNDYIATDTGDVTISTPVPVKEIIATSETSTPETDPRPLVIGEVLHYRLTTSIPEGTSTNVQLVDHMAPGLQLIPDGEVTVQFLSNNDLTPVTYADLAGANSGALQLYGGTAPLDGTLVTVSPTNVITFNLGTLQNTDSDTDAETIVVDFNVVVENTATNATSTLAQARDNYFDVVIDGNLRAMSNTVNAVVVHPRLTITKTPDGATGDAGDTIPFTVVITNPGAAGDPTAFDVEWTDSIPTGMTYVPNTLANSAGVAATLDDTLAPDLSATWAALAPGESSTLTFNVTLDYTLAPNQNVENTATVVWTSLPDEGSSTTPPLSDTPGGSGTSTGERNGSGGDNDYTASDTGDVTITEVIPVKALTATSETGTSETDDPRPVAVGEVLHYVLTMTLPEGTTPNVQLVDTMTTGLELIPDGEVTVTFLSDNAITPVTYTDLAGANGGTALSLYGGTAPLDGSLVNVAGNVITFDLGTLVNNDTDGDAETVVIDFNVVVANDAVNTLDYALLNAFEIMVDGVSHGASDPVSARVVEPVLTLAKDASSPTGDGGDTITFTMTVEHDSTSMANAYDVVITDVIPTGMTWVGNVTPLTGAAPVVDTSALPTVTFTWAEIPLGESRVFTFDVTLAPTVVSGQVITNTANMVWSSLPGEGSSTTSPLSDTPGGSGTPTGERNGNDGPGGLNDYATSDTANMTVSGSLTALKEITATSETGTSETADPRPVAVGEVLHYRLTTSLPEGTSPLVQLVDTMSTGLQLIPDGEVTVTFLSDNAMTPVTYADLAGANGGTALPLYGGTAPLDGSLVNVVGNVIIFDLGTLQNNDTDDTASEEYVVIDFNVVVVNDGTTNLSQALDNVYDVVVNVTTAVTSNTVYATVVEPVLTLAKAASSPTGDGGDTITFTMTVEHDSTSMANAYDVVISDAIPAGMTYAGNVTGLPPGSEPTVNVTLPTVTFTWAEIPLGESRVFTFDVTLAPTVVSGQVITNTANMVWSSLPGEGSSTTSPLSNTPGGSGQPNGERDGSGGVNDYATSDTADVTVSGSLTVLKEITATSETGTPETGTSRPVAVGEVLHYRLTTSLPEGTTPNVRLVDQMAPGLQLIQDGEVTVTFLSDNAMTPVTYADLAGANGGTALSLYGGAAPLDGSLVTVSPTNVITFNLGTLQNNDTDDTASEEYVVVDFNVVVVNDGTTNLGQALNNAYDVVVNGTTAVTSTPVSATVVEPVLTLAKAASSPTGDGGDTITFTMTVAHDATSTADAHDVVISDAIPAGMTYAGNVTGLPPGSEPTVNVTLPTVTFAWAEIPLGESRVFTFDVTLDPTVVSGQVITNTANMVWSSLPGEGSSTTSPLSNTPGGSGTPTGERNGNDGPGGLNDYATSDTANVTVSGSLTALKEITATSETGTPETDPRPVAVGEVLHYRLTTSLPEGTTPNMQLVDQMAPGLQLIQDDEVTVTFQSDTPVNAVTYSALDGANDLSLYGGAAPLDGSLVTVSPTNVITFNLGTLQNNDNDADDEFVIIDFNVVVVNDGTTNLGQALDNVYDVVVNGTTVVTSNTVSATVVEPVLTLQKTASPSLAWVGDTVTFTLSVTHDPTSTADAHDVVITDVIPAGLTWVGNVTATSGVAPTFDVSTLPTVTFSWDSVPQGATYTFTFDVTVDPSVPLGTLMTNTANMVWSSLPGEGSSTTSPLSDTPGGSGQPNGERDGSGGVNDYTTNDTADVLVPNITFTKVDSLQVDNDGDTQVDPGDTLRYTIVLTNASGVDVANAVFTDTPGTNTTLVPGSVTTTQGTVAQGNGGSDTSVTVNLGTFLTGSNVTITFDVLVDFPLANAITEVSNQGTLTGDDMSDIPSDDTGTPDRDDTTITHVDGEPTINVTKVDALYVDANSDGVANSGDTLEYTVHILNTGGRDAENVIFTDTPDTNTTLVAGSVTASQGTVTQGNGGGDTSVTVNVGMIPGGTGDVTITFRVLINTPLVPPTTIQVANQGMARGDNFPDEPSDDTGTAADNDETITPLITAPLIEASKVDALAVDVLGNSLVDPSDTLEYTVVITNHGAVNGTNVVFTDAPDTNTTLVAGSVTTTQGTVVLGNTAGDTSVQVDVGTLAADGGQATITFQVTVNDPLPPGVTLVSNQGLVGGDNFHDTVTDDTDTPEDNDTTDTLIGLAPVIVAEKVDALIDDVNNNGQVNKGDTLEYTIVISNDGAVDAENVVFTDTPDPLTRLLVGTVTTTQGTVILGNTTGDSGVEVNIGQLPVGQSVQITFQVRVRNQLPAGTTQVSNQGAVSGDNFNDTPTDDSDTPEDDDSTDTPIGGGATQDSGITAVKAASLFDDSPSGDGVPSPGDVIQYTITLTNDGTTTATGVVFTDTPDANTTLVAGTVTSTQGIVTTGNTAGDTSVEVAIDDMPPGVSVTVIFNVAINDPLPPEVTEVANQGFVSGDNVPETPTDDDRTPVEDDPTVVVLGGVPRIEVYKVDKLTTDQNNDGVVNPGDVLTYTITIYNFGNVAAPNVLFSDKPDAFTRLVVGSVTVSDPTAIVTQDSAISVTIPTLAPDHMVEITFRVRIDDPLPSDVTQVRNQALVSGDNFPDEPSDDLGTKKKEDDPTKTTIGNDTNDDDTGGGDAVGPQIVVFDPALSKIGALEDGGLGLNGEQLTWTLTITNIGSGAGTDVVITDNVPPALRVDGASIGTGTYSIVGQTVTFLIPRLEAGESILAYIYTTVIDSPLVVDNTATLAGNGPDGLVVTRSATAHVEGVASLPNTGYAPQNHALPMWWIVLGMVGIAFLTGGTVWRVLKR